MIPTRINSSNAAFAPPPNWDISQGECEILQVRVILEDGYYICESAWRPSEAELKALQEGHCVILRVFGRQPPVALYVEPVSSP